MRTWLEHAWLGDDGPGGVHDGVLVGVEDGRFASVETGVAVPPADAERLPGLTVPGFANCHSHAFHRALRGRTQTGRGTFWTWREQMYAVAAALTPQRYHELARAAYAEMVAAGITTVGEFHYLHHAPDGSAYADPNEMGHALLSAADEAGIRITLLDACYLTAGIGQQGQELCGVQRRFGDGDAEAWAQRVEALRAGVSTSSASRSGSTDVGPTGLVGAAVHSVRAVPREQMPVVARWAAGQEAPLHLHLSEQASENDACRATYQMSPTRLCAESGVLGPRTSAVHATHLEADDVAVLGRSGTHACLCPTTERDLGDGVGPARALYDAGSPLTLGSDSHAVVDPFEEMRAVELDERLASRSRGHFSAQELLVAGTSAGQASLGFGDAGRIEVGARADLVTVDTASPRTAGTGVSSESVVFAAGADDVTRVMVGGTVVERDPAELGAALERVVGRVWEELG